MTRTPVALSLAATLAAALAGSAGAGRRAAPTLRGTVGPGFTISLTRKGKKVKALAHGTYRIAVSDKASIHNFVLEQKKGGSFEKAITTVPFEGTKTVTVKLRKGTWKYFCAPHESVMFGTFVVC